MVLWILLFILIVATSFVLAFLSMKDYQEIPLQSKVEYGLYLIRQPQGFSGNFLDDIGRVLQDGSLLVSIERLFKGNQAALTIFGPKNLLSQFNSNLNLLELEDYTQNLSVADLSIWEMGVKNQNQVVTGSNEIFSHLSQLGPEDQFFWQIVLGAKKQGENLAFQTQIRAVVYSKDPNKKQSLVSLFQDLKSAELSKVPRPFSPELMMDFYRQRSLGKDSSGPILTSEGVINLLRF